MTPLYILLNEQLKYTTYYSAVKNFGLYRGKSTYFFEMFSSVFTYKNRVQNM